MWQPDDKVLGIIGGMGPAATQLFYRMIIERTDASTDQEHLEVLLIGHSTMPDRTATILSGETKELRELLQRDACWLEAAGAAAVAIPCNTAHYFADAIQRELSIPVIHMIRETVAWLAKRSDRPKRIGLLATEGTIRSGLYQTACAEAGLEPVLVDASAQDAISRLIYEGIKGGQPVGRADFRAVEADLARKGCDAAVLACTELSVYRERVGLPAFYADALRILAGRCIEHCGKRVKAEAPDA